MRVVPPEDGLVEYVARNVRRSDHHEAMLSHGLSGYEAVLFSVSNSDLCHVLLGDDGVPTAVFGLNGSNIWLLATEGLTATLNHRRQVMVIARNWVDWCLRCQPMIDNHVLARNIRSVRWLKALGFKVEPPAPFGPSAALFSYFWQAR